MISQYYSINVTPYTNPSSVAAITVFFATSTPPNVARSSRTANIAPCPMLILNLERFQIQCLLTASPVFLYAAVKALRAY